MKFWHEFRDPVHQFIKVNSHERMVVDSRPVQRLRNIHQLALTYLVYPGATHRRFEHSLGVMELAGRVFDVVTAPENLTDEVRRLVPEVIATDNLAYWKSVVRMAALCHDIGHLPFSHAAEHDLLPEGVSHESLTERLILSDEMREILGAMVPPIVPEILAKLAVGEKATLGDFSVWEALLTEIITGDAFGVDRMDYLLRDSLHAGVAYGHFDHHRLIGALRILPRPPHGAGEEQGQEPAIGITHGGLQSAEALLLARYFMFSQVYYHPVRVVFDLHLIDFMREWLPDGRYFSEIEQHLNIDDSDVLVALRHAAADAKQPGQRHAKRIVERDHMKLLYERSHMDMELNADPAGTVEHWAIERFGAEHVRRKRSSKSGGRIDFPVLEFSGQIASSLAMSETLAQLPEVSMDRVYVDSSIRSEAHASFSRDRTKIISTWTHLEEDQ